MSILLQLLPQRLRDGCPPELQREHFVLVHHELHGFACKAELALLAGQSLLHGLAAGHSRLAIARATGWNGLQLRAAADLADAYEDVSQADLAAGSFLAFSQGWLRRSDIADAVESREDLLTQLAPHAGCARGLLAWRDLVATDAAPPVERVALQLGPLLGCTLEQRSLPQLADHLAHAFPDALRARAASAPLLTEHAGQQLTAELVGRIAVSMNSLMDAGANPTSAG